MPDDAPAVPGGLYREPARYALLAQWTAPADLGYYRRLLGERPGRLLELGCGTGRLTLPLSRLADETVGLDNAPEMLAYAHNQATREGAQVEFVEADFRSFTLSRRFDHILLPYNALNHVTDDTGMAGLFGAVAGHLAPRGRFLAYTFQPDLDAFERLRARRKLLTYLDPTRQQRVTLFEENDYDPLQRINRITWRYDLEGQADWRVDHMDMRILPPDELDGLFERHGFRIEAKFGDYDGTPFGPRSPKQLIVATPSALSAAGA